MLLGDEGNWHNNDDACFSILGTRVQMGFSNSFQLSSNLVSHAYANSVSFLQVNYHRDKSKTNLAQVCFMLPDPVCAALAMGLMEPNRKLGNESFELQGKSKDFWSEKVWSLFRSGLCLPEKGNTGEVMAALYILFVVMYCDMNAGTIHFKALQYH